jgi:hypothetical protein
MRLWFNTLHGMGAHAVWYWGRDATGLAAGSRQPNGNRARQFVLSALTQPLQMASLHKGVAQLQQHADIVASLASARRSIHLLFCQCALPSSDRPTAPALVCVTQHGPRIKAAL